MATRRTARAPIKRSRPLRTAIVLRWCIVGVALFVAFLYYQPLASYLQTRSALNEGDPNLARFVSQMTFDTTTASDFIRGVEKDGKAADVVASEWMAAHPDQLTAFLDGVTTVSGEPAAAVVLATTGG